MSVNVSQCQLMSVCISDIIIMDRKNTDEPSWDTRLRWLFYCKGGGADAEKTQDTV